MRKPAGFSQHRIRGGFVQLRVEARGRGRAKRVTLPAKRVDLHLVEG